MIDYYHTGLLGAFAPLTAQSTFRALRLPGCRECPLDKCPLAEGTGSEVECWFNGLTRPSSKEPFIVNYRFICNPIDSKYDSLRIDTTCKCLANGMQG